MTTNKIKNMIQNLGADVCGIANIERFDKTPQGFHPNDILDGTQSVIVFGKPFLKSVFKAKTNIPYTFMRNKLIEEIDAISTALCLELEGMGYDALPIPSSEPYEFWDDVNRHGRGILSLKHAAQHAGLGFIGRNTLLVNPQFGNRLWLGGVISNIKLSTDLPTNNSCPPNCRICLDACPQSALDGNTIDQKKCRSISATVTEGGGWVLSCNICRKECPFSRI